MTDKTNIPEGFEEAEREYDWDDEIENDGAEFSVMPEGDYDFVVVDFERARHSGSDKLPPCNKAIVHIRIEGTDVSGTQGTTTINHQLFLHSKTEGLLSDFFKGIGLKKKGEKMKMNWAKVPGSTGRAKVGIREYKGKQYNEIKKFYEKEVSAPATTSAPAQGYTEGKF